MTEFAINKSVICSSGKAYQIMKESLYEQILKTFTDHGIKMEP